MCTVLNPLGELPDTICICVWAGDVYAVAGVGSPHSKWPSSGRRKEEAMPGCAEDHTREGPPHYNTAMEGADEAVFVREKETSDAG